MKNGGYLLLCFGDNAWGRAALARELGEDIGRLGRDVRVVCGTAGAGAFDGSDLAMEIIPNLPGALLKLYFEDLLDRLEPVGVVFCDGDSVLHALRQVKLDPALFARTGARVLAVDTWSHAETGLEADVFGDGKRALESWPEWLNPIRIAPLCRTQDGEEVCSGLFHPPAERPPREAIDRSYAMVSTSPWQHADLEDERGAVVQREVPGLIAAAVGEVEGLDLVHAGAEPLPGFQSLGSRYRWVGALPPADYMRLLSRSAVYLSLSPVCASQAKALGAGVPVILVQHIDSGVGRTVLPYPFRIWPLGYSRFLEPVLSRNPLLKAVTVAELSRPGSLICALRDLTSEGAARCRSLERQASYVESLRAMPRAGSYVIEKSEAQLTI
jgi:hypothetical protein